MIDVGALTKNVFLVGFMGVGKTTVARRLARDLGVAAIDVDAYLHRKYGRDANQLFKQRGEKGLRRLEAEALAECAAMGPAVVSCGEGIVALPANRRILAEEGFSVLLESSMEGSLARVRSLRTRPLLAHGYDTDKLWRERKPFNDEVARV
ncbi:MAG: shikimate kinase, partial [Slackia sp.]|nr:shikimate kinase [Slackia sp.]